MEVHEYKGTLLLEPSVHENWLTNDKMVSQHIYIMPDDLPNWREITQEEYETMRPPPPGPPSEA